MKHVIVPVILAIAIPLCAAEKPAQPDSPLVAAAKRAGRLNKKPTFVITNETLAQMNGRGLTTTSNQPAITTPAALPPLEPTPEMKAAAQAAKEREVRAKIASEQKKMREERMNKAMQKAEQYEEDAYFGDDPAAEEHALDGMTKPAPAQPSTQGQQKPPQP